MKLRRRKTVRLKKATPAKVAYRPSAYGCSGWECYFASVPEYPGASTVLFTGSPTVKFAKAVYALVERYLDLVLIQREWRWKGSMKVVRPEILNFLQWIYREQPGRRELPSFREWSSRG